VNSTMSPCLEKKILESEGFKVREFRLTTIRRTTEKSLIRKISDFCGDGGKIGVFPTVWETAGEVERAPDFEPIAHENARSFASGGTVAIAATNRTVDAYNSLVRNSIYAGREEQKILDEGVVPGDRMVLSRQCPLMYLRSGDEFTVEEIHPGGTRIIAGLRGAKDVHLLHVTASIEELGGRYVFDTYIVKESLNILTNDHDITKVLWVDYVNRCRKLKIPRNVFMSAVMIKNDRYFNAFRGKFSYVRTCHKAQGGEWDTVIVDATEPMSTDPRWGYTASTRPSQRLVVVTPIRQVIMPASESITDNYDLDKIRLSLTNFEITRIKAIDHGCQILITKIGDSENSGLINLYFRGGNLTSFSQTSVWGEANRMILSDALVILEDLTKPQLKEMNEIPHLVDQLLERMKNSAIENHEAKLEWTFTEEWTVNIKITQGNSWGSTFYSFGAKLKGLTSEKIDGRHKPGGEIDLINLIRMLKETRGL
jgi:hypothetical protein